MDLTVGNGAGTLSQWKSDPIQGERPVKVPTGPIGLGRPSGCPWVLTQAASRPA